MVGANRGQLGHGENDFTNNKETFFVWYFLSHWIVHVRNVDVRMQALVQLQCKPITPVNTWMMII